MVATPPFTTVKRTATKQIGSTPLLVYGSDNASFIDGIWVCNTTNDEIFVNFSTLDERNLVAQDSQVMNMVVLNPYESKDLLKGAIIIMEPGDLMYGYTTDSAALFDCHISHRILNEVAG
jgi:hypothetical protein